MNAAIDMLIGLVGHLSLEEEKKETLVKALGAVRETKLACKAEAVRETKLAYKAEAVREVDFLSFEGVERVGDDQYYLGLLKSEANSAAIPKSLSKPKVQKQPIVRLTVEEVKAELKNSDPVSAVRSLIANKRIKKFAIGITKITFDKKLWARDALRLRFKSGNGYHLRGYCGILAIAVHPNQEQAHKHEKTLHGILNRGPKWDKEVSDREGGVTEGPYLVYVVFAEK